MAAFTTKSSFEFKPLFELIFANLRVRNAASGGEEMLRLRAYEKLQSLVDSGAVVKKITGVVKKYKGVSAQLLVLSGELKILRTEWSEKCIAAAAAAA